MWIRISLLSLKKDFLILVIDPTKRLDDTTLTAEAQYSIIFLISNKHFYLSLHYNRNNRFLFVNTAKIYQSKANDSEIKKYLLCLGNISKDFTAINMRKKNPGWNGYIYDFFVDYNIFDTSSIINIQKYLMKKHDKNMSGIIFKMYIVLLASTVCVLKQSEIHNSTYSYQFTS